MYPILPLMAFWAYKPGAGTPLLPSFYTDYYTQEDRFKAFAKIIAQLSSYSMYQSEKINELVERENALELRVDSLEARLTQLEG